jgi:hypothetical protein
MMSAKDTIRENRLRGMLYRQGYRLVKVGRRDTRARDFGQYSIVGEDGTAVAGWPARTFKLDDVEAWAKGRREGE